VDQAVAGCVFVLTSRHERANPADDRSRAIAVPLDGVEELPCFVQIRGRALRERSAAEALRTTAPIGWLISRAIEAVSCPVVVTRLACVSLFCASCRRLVTSIDVPTNSTTLPAVFKIAKSGGRRRGGT